VNDYAEAKVWINLSQRDHDIAVHLHKIFLPMPVEDRHDYTEDTASSSFTAVVV